MFQLVETVAAFLGVLGVTGVAAASVAYLLFKRFATGWIQAQFDRDLEGFKAAKGQELERLRGEITRLMDRATKFHEREYEILPAAWGLLNQAFGATSVSVSASQQHPNFNKMPDAAFDDYLETANLLKHQKVSLKEATDRNKVYFQIKIGQQFSEARKANAEFSNYIILNGIFIADDMAKKMGEAAVLLRTAQSKRELAEMPPVDHRLWQEAGEQLIPIERLVDEIKGDVKRRLWTIQLGQIEEPAPSAKGP